MPCVRCTDTGLIRTGPNTYARCRCRANPRRANAAAGVLVHARRFERTQRPDVALSSAVKHALHAGFSLTQISDLTGLPVDQLDPPAL